MLQRITDLWPRLLGDNSAEESEQVVEGEEEWEENEEWELLLEDTFDKLKWTRVTNLKNFEEEKSCTYEMTTDIKEALR